MNRSTHFFSFQGGVRGKIKRAEGATEEEKELK